MSAELREILAFKFMQFANDDDMSWPEDRVKAQLAAISEDHSGDCTKQPWTCLRCCAEIAYAAADNTLATPQFVALASKDEEIKRLREALAEIARTTPAHVADGFVQGPRVLWLWAQRTARQALQGDADVSR